MASLQVGFGSADITPRIGVPLGGYLGRPQFGALGVHDPLYAKGMALVGEDGPILLFALDLLGLSPERSAWLAETVAGRCDPAPDRVVIACTHTHSGPNTLPLRGIPDVDEEYFDYLAQQMTIAGRQALVSVRPATMLVGMGRSDVGVNRRNPAVQGIVLRENPTGMYDDTLLTLRFLDAASERTLGIVTSYGAHLTAMGSGNMLISAEWAGLAMSALEGELGCPCLFLNGAFGNVSPRGADQTWAGTEAIARTFVADCRGALEAAAVEPALPLRLMRDPVDLPLAPLAPEEEIHRLMVQAREVLTASAVDDTSRRVAAVHRSYADAVEKRRVSCRMDESRPGEIVGLRIGDVALVGMPGEVFAEYGPRLREGSPFRYTVVLGNVGSELGYLPTAEAFAEGGYEPTSYIFFCEQGYSPAIEDVLLTGSRRLLADLAAD